jgi:microcystin-dependent protein
MLGDLIRDCLSLKSFAAQIAANLSSVTASVATIASDNSALKISNAALRAEVSTLKVTASAALPELGIRALNDSLFITAKKQIYFISDPQTYTIMQTVTGWGISNLSVNVGDSLNFTWPAASIDAVALLVGNDTELIQDTSGAPSSGGSHIFTVLTPGESMYASVNHGWRVQVFAHAAGVDRAGLTVPVGTIIPFAGSSVPEGFAACQGQLLDIRLFPVLFSVIGATYGGDGRESFALPHLGGRTAIGINEHESNGLSEYDLGQRFGQETVTLTVQNLPSHNHQFNQTDQAGIPYRGESECFGYSVNSTMFSSSFFSFNRGGGTTRYSCPSVPQSPILTTGGSQPHPNMQPSLVINYIIRLR